MFKVVINSNSDQLAIIVNDIITLKEEAPILL